MAAWNWQWVTRLLKSSIHCIPRQPLITIPTAGVGPFYSIRAVDPDNDGDLEIGLSDLSGRSLLFTNFGAFLDEDLTGIDDVTPGTSLVWGDLDGDGWIFWSAVQTRSINYITIMSPLDSALPPAATHFMMPLWCPDAAWR